MPVINLVKTLYGFKISSYDSYKYKKIDRRLKNKVYFPPSQYYFLFKKWKVSSHLRVVEKVMSIILQLYPTMSRVSAGGISKEVEPLCHQVITFFDALQNNAVHLR